MQIGPTRFPRSKPPDGRLLRAYIASAGQPVTRRCAILLVDGFAIGVNQPKRVRDFAAKLNPSVSEVPPAPAIATAGSADTQELIRLPLGKADAVVIGEITRFVTDRVGAVALTRRGDAFLAVQDRCPHAKARENLTPFRSLDDQLSAVKPILRSAARSPDAVWTLRSWVRRCERDLRPANKILRTPHGPFLAAWQAGQVTLGAVVENRLISGQGMP